jgi:prepilin signal peptidase PulO-like enzyme (type II secretory pathway)
VISLLFAVAGWFVGLLSAWLTDHLHETQRENNRRWLIRDPMVQAALAVVWGLTPLLIVGDWTRWLAVAVLAVPLVQVAVTDLRHRYVYTFVAVIGFVLGVGLGWLAHGGEWWISLIGAAGGFMSFAAVYGVGRLLYRGTEPLARGDVTIAGMVGSIAGGCTIAALLVGVVLSGMLALGFLVWRRSRYAFLPYGPGLCVGGLITLLGFVC